MQKHEIEAKIARKPVQIFQKGQKSGTLFILRKSWKTKCHGGSEPERAVELYNAVSGANLSPFEKPALAEKIKNCTIR